jgi:hypothetical protein
MKRSVDHIAGKAYNRLLSVALGVVAFAAICIGIVIFLTGSVFFSSVWLAAGIVFGYTARRTWRSSASLRETFDGHG